MLQELMFSQFRTLIGEDNKCSVVERDLFCTRYIINF